jgi:LppP/LprE lipoprotein
MLAGKERLANTMADMPRKLTTLLSTIVLGAGAGAVLGGCGSSQTKTVSVAETPTVSQSSTTASTQTQTTTTAPTTTTATTPATAPTSTAGGSEAPTTTRTATEPAFTHQETQSESLKEAAAMLESRGYTPSETSQYHASQTLRVLIGTRTSSSEGYGQQAFFFVDGRYIGTDTKEPSATVKVVSQSDTEVTLGYPLYRPGDPLANPSGGQATVRFQLNDGKLTPVGTIPPASSAHGLSRN